MKLKVWLGLKWEDFNDWVTSNPQWAARALAAAVALLILVALAGCSLPTIPDSVLDRSDKCYALETLTETRRVRDRNNLTDPKDIMLSDAINALREAKIGAHKCDAALINWTNAAKDVTMGNQRLGGQAISIGGAVMGIWALGTVIGQGGDGASIVAREGSSVEYTNATFKGGDASVFGGFQGTAEPFVVETPSSVTLPTQVINQPVLVPAP